MNVLHLSSIACLLFFVLAFRGEAFQDKKLDDNKPNKGKETALSVADAGPDFLIQGEYKGTITPTKISKEFAAYIEAKNLEHAITLYLASNDNINVPDDLSDLLKSDPPILGDEKAVLDPWGKKYQVGHNSNGTFYVFTTNPKNNQQISSLKKKNTFAGQVVAKGDGKFEVYFLTGGLPGDGWDAKGRVKVAAKTEEGKTTFKGKDWEGTISDGKLSGKGPDGDFTLFRVERKSPTAQAKAPDGAIILFDGSSADQWRNGKIVEDKLLWGGCTSKKAFAAGKLHVEFLLPFQPKRSGQGRGNSGVFVQDVEIQVLDSFGLEGKANECGAFYGHAKPAVNMCYSPLSWQTYDVDIKVDDKGQTVATVLFNGVNVHENYVIRKQGPTPHRIYLQDHGDPVVFRNIWFVESK